MSMTFSTGLISYIMGTGSFKAALTNCTIDFYSGARPSTADDAPTGTLLGSCTLNGAAFTPGSPANGLNFDNPVGRSISKVPAENWLIKCVAVGTIGWFRIKANPIDDNSNSTTLRRADGSAGLGSGFDAILSSLNATVGKEISVNVCSFTAE